MSKFVRVVMQWGLATCLCALIAHATGVEVNPPLPTGTG